MKKRINTRRVSPPKSSGQKAFNKERLKIGKNIPKLKIISTKKPYAG